MKEKRNTRKPSCLGSSGKERLPRTYPINTELDSKDVTKLS